MVNLLTIPEELKQKIWAYTPESFPQILEIRELNASVQRSLIWREMLEEKIGISLNPSLIREKSWFDIYKTFEVNWRQLKSVKIEILAFEHCTPSGLWRHSPGPWTGAIPSDSEHFICAVNHTRSNEYSLGVVALNAPYWFLLSPKQLRTAKWPFESEILHAAYHSDFLMISYRSPSEKSNIYIAYFRVSTEIRNIVRVDGPQMQGGRIIALSKEYICIASYSSIYVFHSNNQELRTILKVHQNTRVQSLIIRGERVTAFGYHRLANDSDWDSDSDSDASDDGSTDYELEISTWSLNDLKGFEDVASTQLVYRTEFDDTPQPLVKMSQSIDSNQTIVQSICNWQLLLEKGQWKGYLGDNFKCHDYNAIRVDSQCRYIVIAKWPNYETEFLASIPTMPIFHIYNALTQSRIKTLDERNFPDMTGYGEFLDFAVECRTIILFFKQAIITVRFIISNKEYESSLVVLEAMLRDKSSCGEIAIYRSMQEYQREEFLIALPKRELHARLADWGKAFKVHS